MECKISAKEMAGIIERTICPETKKIGLLFSGGLDSTIIACILKKKGIDFVCYTAGLENSEDIEYAQKAEKKLNLNLKIISPAAEDIEEGLKSLIKITGDTNPVQLGIALPIYFACKAAKEDGTEIVFTGMGSDELFAGYHKYKSAQDIDCIKNIKEMEAKDLKRDMAIASNFGLELRLPFLNESIVECALKIPNGLKIKEGIEKWILRQAALEIGVPEELAMRKKKAAQYGSKFDSAIEKLAKKSGKKYKRDYLNSLSNEKNMKLAALCSSGKDSLFAMRTMMIRNYPVECLITIRSRNPDSFMFHTPNINMAEMQAESIGIPIIVQETDGEKEHELKDLKDALEKAKGKYGIEGIITGALFSQYQKERIEKVADEMGLTVFSPLWHNEQEQEMRSILNAGFEIIFSSIAAEGLNSEWLGRRITDKDIDNLSKLNKKTGMNIAGEGGEFESLVIDAPFFKKKINIEESEIVMENECTGRFIIKKAKLVPKSI